MPYNHFTTNKRIKLEGYLEAGISIPFIAKKLEMHRSSVYREIKRAKTYADKTFPENRIKQYMAVCGSKYALEKRYQANQERRKLVAGKNGWLITYLEEKIKMHWSPEQISGRLARVGVWLNGRVQKIHISIQTIYDWIYLSRKDLIKYLRCQRRYRHSRGYTIRAKSRYKKVRSIDDRPRHIDKRNRYGHWEGDTIVGASHREHIATLVERKSGYLIARKLKITSESEIGMKYEDKNLLGLNASTRFANECIIGLNNEIKDKYLKTITLDNGSEMAGYHKIEEATGSIIYFAHPYHSWERGTNENTNGLIRQYLPKGSSFEAVDQAAIDRITNEINNRPRKRLHWKTPYEVMQNIGALR